MSAYAYQKKQLDNGLRVVTVAMPHLHSATISLFARVGSRHETKDTNGLSHFFEHMLFRGCDGFIDSTALNSAIEDLGGTLDGCTMRDLSAYSASVHPSHALETIDVLAAMFKSPSFRDIDIERAVVLEEMLDSLDHRGRIVDIDTISHREAFKPHPLSQPIDGTKKNVRRFSITDLKRHRRRFYGAHNLVLCCAGNIDPDRCFAAADKHFASLFSGRASKETEPSLPGQAPKIVFTHADDARIRVRLSYRVVSDTHPDFAALSIARRILDNGLSSRLQVEMVELRGLVYEVSADIECYSDCGLFDFEFAVSPQKLSLAFDALGEILADMRRRAPTKECLERMVHRSRIAHELAMDSAEDLSHWFGATELFHEPKTPQAQIDALAKVEPEDVKEIIGRYFTPERLTIAAVGAAEPAVIREAKKTLKKRFIEV